jgi:hypothetical protein
MNEHEANLADVAYTMDYIWNEWGWTQGKMGDQTSGYCLMGSYQKATGILTEGEPLMWAFREAVSRSIQLLFPMEPHCSVEGFNDKEGRSEEDVRLVAKHAVMGIVDLMETDDGNP